MIELEKSGLNRFAKITSIANMRPVSCKANDSIDSVVSKILNSNHRSLPVVDSEFHVVGIITTTDILDSFLIGHDFSRAVSEIMRPEVITCNYNDTIGYVVQKFKMSRRGRFPIKKGKKLVGIVGERDIVKYFANVNIQNKIESIMTTKPLFVTPSISILDTMKTMVNTHYRRLPIVENSKLIGLIMATDLLRVLKLQNYKPSMLRDKLETVMIKNIFSAKKEDDISSAIKTMMIHDIDGIVVADGHKLEGILTERNILEHIN
jgi:CBS domain-containing protein